MTWPHNAAALIAALAVVDLALYFYCRRSEGMTRLILILTGLGYVSMTAGCSHYRSHRYFKGFNDGYDKRPSFYCTGYLSGLSIKLTQEQLNKASEQFEKTLRDLKSLDLAPAQAPTKEQMLREEP